MLNGILNIYKERGYTSFDVVASLRKILGQKKIGHTGTLDPDAEGVLVICLGKATKVVDLITDKDKTYEAGLLLGTVTDTLDITGNVLEESSDIPDEEAVRSAICSFTGEIEQIPPMYSAIRMNGKHLYELAREGKEVERKSRKVNIHGIDVLKVDLPHASFRVECSKGTYIRTLCDDIGKKLGCGACMESLKRTRVGEFTLDSALKLSEVKEFFEKGSLGDYIKTIDFLFQKYNKAVFSPNAQKMADNGNALPVDCVICDKVSSCSKASCGRFFRIYDSSGVFYGIYKYDAAHSCFKLVKFFKET